MDGVLLTHGNHLLHDRKQVEKMQPYPPLQTLFAAAVLREAGIAVDLCDVTFDSPEEAFEAALEAAQPRLVVVCEDDFNFLSKMCLGRNRELAFWMARIARERGIPCAVHSSDSSDHPLEYLVAGFDYVLSGEVETTLLELVRGDAVQGIAGLIYRDSATGKFNRTARRVPRTNLDTLPEPARDLVAMDRYRAAWHAAHGYFSLNMVSSRGCPYRCNWCARPIWGASYHARSAQLVAREMLNVKRRYNPDHIWFADDIFALSGQWTLQFADCVESLGARIPFKMQSRCDLMTRDTVSALERAGCCEVWMGAESGSQRILDAMEKGIRVEQVYRARENLRRNGIRAGFFLQFGYPSETWDDILQTIHLVRESMPDDIGVSVSYPLPGTRFHQLVASQMAGPANWRESGDLAMMFRGAFSSEFYRALAEALHLEVRRTGTAAETRTAWERVEELRSSAPVEAMAL
ncbi:MAG TPA: radical SAM protein [Bryobacteraceae bacterium]